MIERGELNRDTRRERDVVGSAKEEKSDFRKKEKSDFVFVRKVVLVSDDLAQRGKT